VKPSILNSSYEIKLANGQIVETNKIVRKCNLVLEGYYFSIDLIPFGHGTFDVIVGKNWLSKFKAEIVCHEKIVRVPLPNGKSKEEHEVHLKLVLELLKKEKLFAKFSKCEFWVQEVQFLGHVINSNGIHMDPSYYRRFIANISTIAKPLTSLTQKDKKFDWGAKQEEAFQNLKEKLCNAPILMLPDGPGEFVVYYDASNQGFGCVLMQRGKVIAYTSQQLKIHEKNYTTHDLELGAVVFALEIWRHYLYRTKSVIYTDHRSLQHIFDQKELNMRHRRWIEIFIDYDCEIRYHPGKKNVMANALSRKEKVKPRRVLILRGLDKQMERKGDGGLYFVDRIWVSSTGYVRTLIMDEAHAMKHYVHLGADKMYYDLRDMYWWPGMKKDTTIMTKSAHFLAIREDYKMEKLARIYINEIVARHGVPVNWDTHLPLVELSYNNSYYASIKYAPFEALYGQKCRSPGITLERRSTFWKKGKVSAEKCLANTDLHVPLDDLKIDDDLRFVEDPLEIMDREVKRLK
ncbi:putative reverse transcriptase domain-containing protein, partial [Tanacetum coccineum]